MFKRIVEAAVLLTMTLSLAITAYNGQEKVETVTYVVEAQEYTAQQRTIEQQTLIKQADEVTMSQEDIELIALVTMAEAEGECEEGKRLVIDTILNRVDHERFPNTVSDVIYQPNQFTSMHNGRVDRCYVDNDICKLVREELNSRTNTDVIFFHAGKYSNYGTPLIQVENHYFSSYD